MKYNTAARKVTLAGVLFFIPLILSPVRREIYNFFYKFLCIFSFVTNVPVVDIDECYRLTRILSLYIRPMIYIINWHRKSLTVLFQEFVSARGVEEYLASLLSEHSDSFEDFGIGLLHIVFRNKSSVLRDDTIEIERDNWR